MTLPMPPFANALVELFLKGGPIMWPIAIVTLFAVAIVVERTWWWLQLSRHRNGDRQPR